MSSFTSGYDQPSTRMPGTLKDQHGRLWSATIDKKSGYPVGVIQPKGWRAPWLPNQGFFKFENPDDNRSFRIAYDQILDQRLKAHEDWASQFRQAALVRGWNPDDQTKQSNITELVGTKPLPIEPVVACMQGNKWMLGLTDKVDPRLEPFVVKRTDRVSRVVAEMDFSDADDAFEDTLADLEDEIDPDAIGGKKVNPRKRKAA